MMPDRTWLADTMADEDARADLKLQPGLGERRDLALCNAALSPEINSFMAAS